MIAALPLLVTIVATGEIKGTAEPCGCTSDPLGDVSRVASLAKGGLWVDAGSLLYDETPPGAPGRVQSDLKAQTLARICVSAGAEVGLGPDDLRRTPKEVAPPR